MKMLKNKSIKEFIKFGMVGVVNTCVSYSIYALLTQVGVWYILSSLIGFVISVFISFELNHRFVFKDSVGGIKALLKVYSSYGITTILSTLLLYIWVDKLSISEYIAPIINLIITVPINFILNKFWSFKGEKNVKRG